MKKLVLKYRHYHYLTWERCDDILCRKAHYLELIHPVTKPKEKQP